MSNSIVQFEIHALALALVGPNGTALDIGEEIHRLLERLPRGVPRVMQPRLLAIVAADNFSLGLDPGQQMADPTEWLQELVT